ncbi:MAG TPA: hypothetical protein ENL03_02590 [Phycisphaerae bacterium]|nr:hypothetical protein [Phycisphaerae bacterium]
MPLFGLAEELYAFRRELAMKYAVIPTLALCFFLVTVSSVQAAGKKSPTQGMGLKIDKPSITGTVYDCFQQIGKLSGMEMKIDWEILVATGVKPDTKAIAKASKATVGQLLDLLLLQVSSPKYPLAWVKRDGVILVTTQVRLTSARPSSRVTRPVAGNKTSSRKGSSVTKYDFQAISLSDALEFMRTSTNLNFHVNWNSLASSGIDKTSEVTLQASGITVAHALDIILDSVSADLDKFGRAYWIVDRGVVTIATGDALNTKTRTKIYNVADLLHVVNDHRVTSRRIDRSDYRRNDNPRDDYRRDDYPRDDYRRDDDYRRGGGIGGGGVGIGGGGISDSDYGRGNSDRNDDDNGEKKETLREGLIELIKNTIGEDMWQPTGLGSIKIFGDKLIVTQSLLGFKLMSQRTGN